MFNKKLLINMVTGAVAGYFIAHPIVMLTAYSMALQPPYVAGSIYTAFLRSFSIQMLPWSLAFAIFCAGIGSLIGKIKQAYQEKSNLISELQDALAQVKTLRGLLPICAWCKKIRDDQGYWTRIESYIKAHTDADFSHGICPACAAEKFPEYFKNETDEQKS